LITAGGENVAPVLIECEIKRYLTFLSNVMVVGDARKFLAVLVTLKYDLDKEGKLTENLSQEVLNALISIGSTSTTYNECTKDEVLRKHIDEQIKMANSNAISNAQHIKKWTFIRGDFTVDGGELTPTLKLKRKVATEKN
jgi:long-chain-fatty-acid--CoA ligase ACSBG